ncbi:MAG: acyl-CoA dehydrogenase family protein [Acidimicrobiales bacterium]
MNLAFSEEQEELRRSLRRFLEERSPSSEVRRLMETTEGYDPAVWAQMAGQLGLQSLGIPEEYGGSGFGAVELAAVMEEMGRALLCAPYLSSAVIAASCLLACADEGAKADLLPAIASGDVIASLALCEGSASWDPGATRLPASREGGGWSLTGVKQYVLDGHVAQHLLVPARTDGGVALFCVDGDAAGVTRTPLPTLDQTRKLARVELEGARARLLGADRGAEAGLAEALARSAIALAAEQVGGAQRCLEMSVEHAKTRVQFGRPIGSFQAVKHRCADMLVEVESARSAAYYGAWVAAEAAPELAAVASLAKATCSEAFFRCAADSIQIHGGIGFTWEHDAHLYFKRAKADELLLGDPAYHRELLARRIGL